MLIEKILQSVCRAQSAEDVLYRFGRNISAATLWPVVVRQVRPAASVSCANRLTRLDKSKLVPKILYKKKEKMARTQKRPSRAGPL